MIDQQVHSDGRYELGAVELKGGPFNRQLIGADELCNEADDEAELEQQAEDGILRYFSLLGCRYLELTSIRQVHTHY